MMLKNFGVFGSFFIQKKIINANLEKFSSRVFASFLSLFQLCDFSCKAHALRARPVTERTRSTRALNFSFFQWEGTFLRKNGYFL